MASQYTRPPEAIFATPQWEKYDPGNPGSCCATGSLRAMLGRNGSLYERSHLPALAIRPSHILGEPMGRNSAPAIAWVAATIASYNPEAIMAAFSADAVITNVDALRQTLHLAYELAETKNYKPYLLGNCCLICCQWWGGRCRSVEGGALRLFQN